MDLSLDAKTIIGIASVAIVMANHVYYAILTYLKRIRPHAFTQFVYFIVTISVAYGMYAEGDVAAALRMGLPAPLYILILIMTLKQGFEYIKRIDAVMLIFSLMALPLWWLTESPRVAILFLAIVEGFAIIPAFRKAYHLPWEESYLSPLISSLAMVLALIAVTDHFEFWATALYLAYWTLLCSLLAGMIVWRRYVLKAQKLMLV